MDLTGGMTTAAPRIWTRPGFAAARTLYASFGFEPCGPFGDYVEDPNSVFMRLRLR
jgi:putative acetyltransferase